MKGGGTTRKRNKKDNAFRKGYHISIDINVRSWLMVIGVARDYGCLHTCQVMSDGRDLKAFACFVFGKRLDIFWLCDQSSANSCITEEVVPLYR